MTQRWSLEFTKALKDDEDSTIAEADFRIELHILNDRLLVSLIQTRGSIIGFSPVK